MAPQAQPTMTRRITVLVADDHPMIIAGIRNILEPDPEISLLPEHVTDGKALYEKIARLKPHVLLLDLRMPNLNPVPAIKTITSWYDAPRIIVLSSIDERAWIHACSRAGAAGYITKDDATSDWKLREAIKQVVSSSGAMYYSPNAKQKLFTPDPITPKMTPLQHDVLKLLCDGLDIPDIASAVDRSANAVHQILRRLRDTMGVDTNHALVREALAKGIVPSPRTDDDMPDPGTPD